MLQGTELAVSSRFVLPASAPIQQYLSVPLARPAGGSVDVPPGSPTSAFTYSPNDASAADLDGDGEYELVVKWDPSNSRDNASAGLSGRQLIDAYKIDGTRLWRIDLGRNIRAGAHYTQFMVYDLDGDGPDWEITGPLSVSLRAERSGVGTGRVYTIQVEGRDSAGNTTLPAVTVSVPLERD